MPYSDGAISVSHAGSNGLLIGVYVNVFLLVGRLYEVIHSKDGKSVCLRANPEAVIDSFMLNL